jgi:hypothetical protein
MNELLFGSKIDKDFNHCLKQEHILSWESILQSPKSQKELEIDAGKYFLRPMKYHVLHGNGFLRLATKRGMIYWLVQNSKEHKLPDWKFHISVAIDDLPKAWNIIAALFMEARCELGMKATTDKDWPEFQFGREITIYAYSHCFEYENNYLSDESVSDPDFRLGQEIETIYSTLFWFQLLTKIDKHLKKSFIITNGKADGDLELPGLEYITLRNEAFVIIDGIPSYPPNELGYNASKQFNPFLELIYYFKKLSKNEKKHNV